ncbi:MAG: enoyl-CoA hydratase/isomerase family protein [Spirochaetes bacterium]|nr:MAG: enoyl-CoA hydratase/isomerase family protein [Spirochaetota bacterium]
MSITFTKEHNTVALVTMDSGENRQNPEFMSTMAAVLDEIEADESFKSVVLCSKHEKFWSVGIDVEWMGGVLAAGKKQEARDFVYSLNALSKRMLTYPMPLIAAIGGHTFGDGAMLALCCDFRFMKTDRGFFCFPEVDINIAFMPSMLDIIRKTIPAWFMEEMILTGRKVGAKELEDLHIVRKACANEEELLRESLAFAATFAKPRGIFAEHKKRMYKSSIDLMDSEDPAFIEPLNLTA